MLNWGTILMLICVCQTVSLSRVIGTMLWLTTGRLRRWCSQKTLLSASASLSFTTRWDLCVSRMGQNHMENIPLTPTQRNLESQVIKCHLADILLNVCVWICRRFQEAVDMFSLAIQHNPASSHYYESRSKAFRKLLNLSGARQDFICMLILDPTHEEVSNSLIFCGFQ